MALADFRSPRVFWRWLRQWRRTNMVDKIDRVEVLTRVDEDGAMGARFAFMTLMACGIATLGLLQNSVAVIIGAMLIAPLMGPIIELGMGLATFDFRTVRSALKTIAVGIALAPSMAMIIVWLSPLKQATPEILARTQPTFFDLLVAIFSGLAGAYATITHKGEAIVGVAIATALMPPLAVMAYGLALANWSIAGGAGMLFMTNLLAIALSVTAVARLYGFGGNDTPRQTAWQAALIIGTFVLLSIPLGLSLQRIARQTQTELAIRSALDQAATSVQGRVSALRVDTVNNAVVVDAVLMTPRFVHGLDQKLSRQLSTQLGRQIDVRLREVVTTDDDTLSSQQATLSELTRSINALEQAEQARDSVQKTQSDARGIVTSALAAHFGTLENGPGERMMTLRLAPAAGFDLAQAHALEQELTTSLEALQMQVLVVPPLRALPPVPVEPDGKLDAAAAQMLDIQAWALLRWQVAAIDCVGFSRNSEEAKRQADTVAAILRRHGVVVGDARAANSADRRAAPSPDADTVWLRLPAK